jgi:expansin (peptidoglycan-binding protein)
MIRAFIVLLVCAAGPALAGCPLPAFTGSGDGTFYVSATGVGNCTIEFTSADHIAAINAAQWAGSAHCGECLRVTGPLGTVDVKVVDQCPECLAGDLDLSPSAFAAIADPLDGRVGISWTRIECPVIGSVDYRFQGSNDYYVKLQALDHRVGVASMELKSNGAANFTPMARVDDNFFVRQLQSALQYPIVVRTTATTGEAIQQSIPAIVNNVILPGSAQFAGCQVLFADSFE